MRKWILVTSAMVAVFFTCFFGYTFLARAHLDGIARESVTARARQFADPTVDVAAMGLRNPQLGAIVNPQEMAALQAEIAEYRRDPGDYILQLASGVGPPAGQIAGDNPVVIKLGSWKDRVREHFDKVVAHVLRDLRIFAASSVAAALLATWLACRREGKQAKRLVPISLLLSASVAFGVFMYVDSPSFFKILFDTRLGWSYPILLVLVFLFSFCEYRATRAPTDGDEGGSRSEAAASAP